MRSNLVYIIILSGSLMSMPMYSQVLFRVAPELGISVTERQERNISTSAGKKWPVTSPTYGINCVLKLKKHFQFSSGLKYETAGYRLDDEPFNQHDKLVYRKLCLPVKACIIIGKSRVKMIVFTGYSPNYLLKGYFFGDTTPVNLFHMQIKPERFTNQFTFGCGLEFSDLALNASFNMGKHLKAGYSFDDTRFWNGVPIGVRHIEYILGLDNDSYNFSLTYFIRFKRK